jgi:crotonobetainyl-CoA:carnitine CoA-transferase CaiB-like acyl-CoA transferase
LLADRIGGQRGRTSGTVAVNSRHAESSLLSFAHLAFTDRRRGLSPRIPGEARTAAAGFYPTKDQRWVYLHSGFPHNTAGLLDLLGVEDDGPAVSGAIAGWEAQDLEDAIARAGLCGAMVRSAQEWDASPAGRLLAARPVVELIQLDDSPPEPFPAAGDRPLAGIKVLDLTRILAGPTCARTLASYGAQVLRVGAAHLPRNLVGEADVFSQGYRSGAMERLGFSVSEVVRQRPGIVYVSINCYGHEGAWRARPGWEQLAQTVTGMAATQGAHLALDQPTLLPAAVNDYITGYLAAFGTLAALARRASHGGSYWVRVSLSRTAVWVRSLALRRAVTARPMTEQELSAASGEMESAWGSLRYLTPAVSLTSTDVGWQRPPSPLGSDEPAFVT